MRTVPSFEKLKIDRRTFVFGSFAAAMGLHEKETALVTLTQWVNASPKERKDGLQPCLDRIRRMDSSIHAWVQVHPEKQTGDGRLSEIPFGAKDIMETRGLPTEYGSPIYKGRIGTEDAAIVSDLRQRGGILLGKTQCAAFAYRTPPPTRNPRDLAHTPGKLERVSGRGCGWNGAGGSGNSDPGICAAARFLLRRHGV